MAVDLPREIALKILYDINEKGAYSNISINKYLEGYEVRDLDKAFITELVYGTVKWRLAIDWGLEQFSSIKIKKISPWILNILRLGIYQLLYTSKIPPSAACNESVNLAKRYGHAAARGYVNGVLRGIVRGRENIRYPDKEKEYERYLSVRYSHPEWMVKAWLGRLGREFTEKLLESNNEIPEFCVRVNTLCTTREKLLEELGQAGIEALHGKYVEEAVILKNPSSITKLEAFKKGKFQVQDESSMLVARVLDPQPGEMVLDVCSAPGGKATHMAQLMGNKGTVIARDIHEHKIKMIAEAAKRLGMTILRTETFDASITDEALVGQMDRVLVDAPCTGLGIIRRKPDIKWVRNIEDRKEIIRLQSKILHTAAKYVKPGGKLVYSTCTLEPEENENQVQAFLGSHQEFRSMDISYYLPAKLAQETAKEEYIQTYPNRDGVDGFFIARMERGSSHE